MKFPSLGFQILIIFLSLNLGLNFNNQALATNLKKENKAKKKI